MNRTSTRRSRALASATCVALALAALALASVAGLAAIVPGLLFVLPALALACLLAIRVYPGERLLARARRVRRARWPRAAASRAERRPVVVLAVRGGLLLACALAVRPPPPLPVTG